MAEHIWTPLEIHGVRTLQEYRQAQFDFIQKCRLGYPSPTWVDPYLSADPVVVLVDGGTWKVTCATAGCGNYPVVDPVAAVALCFNCGAVYEDVAMPAEAAGIEARLIIRPFSLRYWTTETLEELDAMNAEWGYA